jgi:hypothetical protein
MMLAINPANYHVTKHKSNQSPVFIRSEYKQAKIDSIISYF